MTTVLDRVGRWLRARRGHRSRMPSSMQMFGRMGAILARSTAGSSSPSISRAISSKASAGVKGCPPSCTT